MRCVASKRTCWVNKGARAEKRINANTKNESNNIYDTRIPHPSSRSPRSRTRCFTLQFHPRIRTEMRTEKTVQLKSGTCLPQNLQWTILRQGGGFCPSGGWRAPQKSSTRTGRPTTPLVLSSPYGKPQEENEVLQSSMMPTKKQATYR